MLIRRKKFLYGPIVTLAVLFAGSAVLSSSNVAGSGVLAKAYPHTGSTPPGRLEWDDTRATHATIIPAFPGQPETASAFANGLEAPFMTELSGVIVFGTTGPVPLALQCAGRCQLYLYGAPPRVQRLLVDIVSWRYGDCSWLNTAGVCFDGGSCCLLVPPGA